MSNSTKRDSDVSRLHPAIRSNVAAILDKLHSENIPFEVFEAFRTPERQADLFAQGRTKPGDKVTWVGPWRSIHQYGLAVDLVLKIDGDWSWDGNGARAKFWPRMHAIAKGQGMTPLFNKKGQLIELPHIQLVGLSTDALYSGSYPSGGDAVWAEHLVELIENWSGSIAPPPRPPLIPGRPALNPADAAELEDKTPGDDGTGANKEDAILASAAADAQFQRLHAFVKQWEGGFVNDPRDNGGATNMGITLATLAAWRRKEVTVEDVRTLTRAEADAIFRTNYYAVCRCGEMPERTAMVVYNGAVLHGPGRSIMFLQSAFNKLGMMAGGKPLGVDGVIGSKTIEAARRTDAGILADAYVDLQEAYLRKHEDFDAFGRGWLNRLAGLREFVATLPQGAGLRPKTVMKISDTTTDSAFGDILGSVLAGATDDRKADLGALLDSILQAGGKDTEDARHKLSLLRAALGIQPAPPVVPVSDAKLPLTPVNAALGEGLGRLLDGKKSVIGVVGLILTTLLPEIGLAGPIINFVDQQGAGLTTLLATFTGWGFLGKIDKAVRAGKTRP